MRAWGTNILQQHHYPPPIHPNPSPSHLPNRHTEASSLQQTVNGLDCDLLPIPPTVIEHRPSKPPPHHKLLSSKSNRSVPSSTPNKSSRSSNNAGEHRNFPHCTDALP